MATSFFFRGRGNDGSACTNRQSADRGQNVITRCTRSPRIGKRLSDFTGRNMRIYEVATMDVFIEHAISQLRKYFYLLRLAVCFNARARLNTVCIAFQYSVNRLRVSF